MEKNNFRYLTLFTVMAETLCKRDKKFMFFMKIILFTIILFANDFLALKPAITRLKTHVVSQLMTSKLRY